jgi:DNA helicase HerA-like ATPase
MNIEGLGTFYIGRTYDLAKKKQLGQPVLYDANDLVTHAVCVGMTGSGKTGLCIGLLEEAALDGIPALVIDPKGDLVNLLLTFPELKPENFAPWINLNDAARKGLALPYRSPIPVFRNTTQNLFTIIKLNNWYAQTNANGGYTTMPLPANTTDPPARRARSAARVVRHSLATLLFVR